MLRTCALLLSACAALVVASGSVRAESPEGARYGAWRSCLKHSFGERAALSSRGLAADAALRECRESEGAYLAALSASPLLDGDDAARARPALQARARLWLLGPGGPRQL